MKDLEETVSSVPANAMGASSPTAKGPIAMPERMLFKKKKRVREPKKLRAILGEASVPVRDRKSAEKEISYPRATGLPVAGPYQTAMNNRRRSVESMPPKKRDEMFMDHISSGKSDPSMSVLAAKHGSDTVRKALMKSEIEKSPEDRNTQAIRTAHHYGGKGIQNHIAKNLSDHLGSDLGEGTVSSVVPPQEVSQRNDGIGDLIRKTITNTSTSHSKPPVPPAPSAKKPAPKPQPINKPKTINDLLKNDEVNKLGRQFREPSNAELEKMEGKK
jgi:hypothetical protein